MRIACVDTSAVDRLKLERFLDDAFRECRRSVGHMVVARFFPASKEEIIVNSAPDVVIIGSAFSPDDALILARDLSSIHSDIPVFIFLEASEFTIRNIKRFEPYVKEVFSLTDPSSRFVYSLTALSDKEKAGKRGMVVAVQGVKGGVGATSVTGAFAHAAHAIGKSVAIVDLSQRGEVCQYFLCDQWHSSEYTSLLSDKVLPEPEHLQKILVTAKNGITIMPPPYGYGEVRELWLRDVTRFEIPLALLDLLQERFDVVLVDFSHAEGIFPFAVECRADVRLFVSANEPGSVHLLTSRVDEFEMSNEGVTRFIINKINPRGLTNEDILDFISWSPRFSEEMLYPEEVPYDAKGGLWIGTGNSFYTEGSAKVRTFFENLTRSALGLDEPRKKSRRIPFANTFKAIGHVASKKQIGLQMKERLPYFEAELTRRMDRNGSPVLPHQDGSKDIMHSSVTQKVVLAGEKSSKNISDEKNAQVVYEPPRLRANE
jgi:cellulose biosynthesis protein BcsQ